MEVSIHTHPFGFKLFILNDFLCVHIILILQDTSVTKSREELLAEERDYKRRRMSYRGKKIKRTTTQVIQVRNVTLHFICL